MIILKINNIETDVVGELSSKDYNDLEKRLSFRPEGYQFSPAFNSMVYRTDENGKKRVACRKWDGWKHLCWRNKKRTYFMTGLLSLATEFFKERKIEFKRRDLRVVPEKNLFLELDPKCEERDYQLAAVEECIKATRGILQAATGSGKTAMACRLVKELGIKPFLFFVTSKDLLQQAKDAFESFLLKDGKHIKVGQIGDGIVDIQDITVLTIQTTCRALGIVWNKDTKFDDEDTDDDTDITGHEQEILNLMNSAVGSIADECQHWKSRTCSEVFKSLPKVFFKYGFSATPTREEGDDLVIQGCFGKFITRITASQLIRNGWLIRPTIKMVHIQQERSSLTNYQNIYSEYISDSQHYNNVVANIANAYIQQGRTVLVLVKHLQHGETLAKMISGSCFANGSWSRKRRKETLDALRRKEISCIISSQIFDEGVDVRALDTVLLSGQGKSKVRAMQRIGRILRPYSDGTFTKTKATAIDFVVHQKFLEKHAKEREKMYRTEEEYIIEHLNV